MRSHYLLGVALATAFHLIGVSTARANKGAVLVYGDVQPRQREVVTAAVTATVREASWAVEDAPFSSKQTEGIVACLGRERPWSCFASTVEPQGLAHMAVVRVERDGTGVKLVEQILVADGDWVPSIEQETCNPCNDATLTESAKQLTKVLLERTAARLGTTAIEIRTVPAGALVTFDGAMLGETNRIPTKPGEHTVLLQLTGYQPASRTVMVKQGQTFALEVTMTPTSASTSGGGGDDRPSRILPFTLLGAGGAALAAGITLMLVDEDPVSSPDQDAKRTYRDTMLPGIGFAVGGAVVAGIGGYWLWRRSSKQSAVTTVTPVSGGAVIGMTKAF